MIKTEPRLMTVIGMQSQFAIRRSDGRYDVGHLSDPKQTHVEDSKPYGARVIDRTTYEAARSSAEQMRRAAFSASAIEGALVALHVHKPQLTRGAELADAAVSRIEVWSKAGKPDTLKGEDVVMPPSLENLQSAIEQVGLAVSRQDFKATFLAAPPEQQALTMHSMNALLDAIQQLSGVRDAESLLAPMYKGLSGLNNFLLDTGAPRIMMQNGHQLDRGPGRSIGSVLDVKVVSNALVSR